MPYSGPIFIASDHGGFQLKNHLLEYFAKELKLLFTDLGPTKLEDGDDYPDYVFPLAKKVVETNGRGILICKKGIGVCMAANKVPGIRAGISYNLMAAESMRHDDDTNIMCLAAYLSTNDHAVAMVKKWLTTDFGNDERYVRRLEKIKNYENKK